VIDLYGSISPNVQKVVIAIEEVGLEHLFHSINVHQGQQFTPEFRSLNPIGKIPVIVDHDGPDGRPITVFESGAILLYLAEKCGKLLPVDAAGRTEAIQWLMFQMSSVGPTLGQFNHFVRYAAEDLYGVNRFTTAARKVYDVVEERLGRSAYLGGSEYSIADIATYPWIRVESRLFGETHPVMRIDWEGHPNIARWVSAIEERAAVRKALIQIDAMQYNRGTGTSDDVDRLFGRGRHARTLA
jgi:GST-like protein